MFMRCRYVCAVLLCFLFGFGLCALFGPVAYAEDILYSGGSVADADLSSLSPVDPSFPPASASVPPESDSGAGPDLEYFDRHFDTLRGQLDLIPQEVVTQFGDYLSRDDASPSLFASLPSNISGGYYMDVDCALGSNIRIWVPAEFSRESLAFAGSDVINMTARTLNCAFSDPLYSDYTLRATSFGVLYYRSPGGASMPLNITSVLDTNISFMVGTQQVIDYPLVIVALLFLIFVVSLFRSVSFLTRSHV